MSDVARTGGGGVVNMKDYASRLQGGIADSRASTVIAGGGKPLLRLLRDGEWVFGQSNEGVQDGSSWAVNILTLSHGWQCWVKDNPNDPNSKQTLQGEILVPMTEPKPVRPPPIKDKAYDEVRAFELKCTDGDDALTEVLYKTNSIGGMRAVDGLLAEIYRQLADDPEHAFPVIVLGYDHYQHKTWGKIYTPVFEITGWADTNLESPDDANLPPDDNDEPEPKPQQQPARRTSEPAAAAAASQANTKKKKEPLTAAAKKDAAPAPTTAARAGQRRRPGR